jgi:hypothetical protein
MLSQQLDDIFLALCEDADTPRALTAWLLYRHKEYGQLVSLTTDPSHYLDSSGYTFLKDSAVSALFEKYRDFAIPGINRPEQCRLAFLEDERTCEKSNDRLRPYLSNSSQELSDRHVWESLSHMQAFVRGVLGRIPDDLDDSRFGPGATFGDKGSLTTVPDKLTSRPTSTRDAWWLAPLWERTAWARAQWSRPYSGPLFSRGNRFTTVPKSAKKDRGIAIEPSINVYFQLGVGSVIRRALKRRAGVDLDHGQTLHRAIACEASRRGSYATIDLSSASDTVCKVLVELLVPEDWYSLLDALRSKSTFIDGRWHHLSKFSSMGNGFTFELETLIFLAIGREACRLCGCEPSQVHVYGDDILVPTEAGATCVSLLRYFGFRPNPKKTFLTGVFRESCGGDFFNGVRVRPHYLKEYPDEPQKTISLANGLSRLGSDCPPGGYPYHFSARSRDRAIEALPSPLRRLRGPEVLGDIVIHDDDPRRWIRRIDSRGRCWVKGYQPIPLTLPLHHWRSDIIYASALYGVPSDGVTPRGGVSGYAVKWVAGG